MNDDFRTRGFLPAVVPIAILVVVVGLIGLFAWLLLYNTREGAAALAIVGAAGILVAISLAASQDQMSRSKQVGAALAVVGPLGVGLAIAVGAFGVPAEDLNINVEAHGPEFLLPDVPPEAPLMAAVDLTSFCLPTDGGGCEPTREWDLDAQEDPATFLYAFHNMDTTSQHNLALYGLPEESAFGSSADSLGTDLVTPELPETFIGDETRAYQFEWPAAEGEAEPTPPEQFYFVCTIHPSTMYGVATLAG